MSVPPNYNVIYQNPNIPFIEGINKVVFDQSVLVQPTVSFMDAYALMPTDNSSTIAVGSDVAFPRLGSSSTSDIVPLTTSSFTLGPIGVYDVYFQVGVTDASGCQLALTLNNVLQPQSVSGLLGSDVIIGRTLLTTTVVNSVVTVRNPTGNLRPITVTASLGGTNSVSAHLIITRLK